MLYALSLVFGLAEAFYIPASMAIMPRILGLDYLLAGNSIVQGTTQLSLAAGPALAGLLIALFTIAPETAGSAGQAAGETVNMTGIGLAFGINGLTYLFSIAALLGLKVNRAVNPKPKDEEGEGMFASVRRGVAHVFQDPTLRLLVLVTAISHFCMEGSLFIGVPLLADTRFTEGAAAFGIIMSALGAGMLLGIILAGTLPRLNPKYMGMVLLSLMCIPGVGLVIFGFTTTLLLAAALVAGMGAFQGFAIIQYTSWIQLRTPPELLGRVMSMMILASIGLIPIAQTLAGVLFKFSTTWVFVGAGVIMTLVIGLVAIRPEMRAMGLEPRAE
jgi:MFS family permease